MKRTALALPVLLLLALAFVLTGCPKKDKMMGDATRPNVVHIG